MSVLMRALARLAVSAAAIATMAFAAVSARASDWPIRSVSILVPTAAGGNTDLMARLAAEHLTKRLGQPFVVQNRPGAGGVLAAGPVATADPDGYTLLFSPSAIPILTPLVQTVQFDPAKLVPVTNVGTASQVAAVRRALPVTSLAEFLAYAKANPGKLNFAIAGTNNISHLGPIMLFKRAQVELTMVPARGEPQAITDLISGNVDFYFGNSSVLLNSDLTKIRILAVGTGKRIATAPELPTISETVPGIVFESWNGLFVPAGTPDAIVSKLRASIAEMVAQPDMQKRLVQLGIVPGGQSQEEVERVFKQDRAAYQEMVALAGIKKQ